jgi:short-subunit dehydrogenase
VTRRPRAVITGATSGIGLEFATEYARRGHDLVLAARSEGDLARTSTDLSERFGVECTSCVVDLSSVDGVGAFIESVASAGAPDVLVLNAGITLAARVGTSSPDVIGDAMTLLALGPMLTIERIAPLMVAAGKGDIIVVSSIASQIPMPRSAVYASAKAAITSYARSIHRELRGDGVRVVAVNPGYVRTNLHRAAGLDHLARVVPSWLWLEPEAVVRSAIRALARGRDSVTPGFVYRVSRPFLASDLAQNVWRRLVRRGRTTR